MASESFTSPANSPSPTDEYLFYALSRGHFTEQLALYWVANKDSPHHTYRGTIPGETPYDMTLRPFEAYDIMCPAIEEFRRLVILEKFSREAEERQCKFLREELAYLKERHRIILEAYTREKNYAELVKHILAEHLKSSPHDFHEGTSTAPVSQPDAKA